MKELYKVILVAWAIALASMTGTAHASIAISPSSVQVNPGAQLQFSATGSSSTIVVWGLSGAGCSGISCGEINSSGLYTAPSTAPSPSLVTVTAFSIIDGSQATAAVTVGSQGTVAVTITPASVTLSTNSHQQFTATVTGSSNQSVTWSVSGIGCVAASCGSISSSGLYTAPSSVPSPALATITATSVANPAKSASASVVIQQASAVSVSVSPSSAQVSPGGQQQFAAAVTGTTNTAVTWSVSGSGCSGAACGSISGTGLYTAPLTTPSPATVRVIATSVASSSASGSATVTLSSGSTLTISPALPLVKPGAQIQFSANGPGSGIVVWGLSGNGCVGIACGSISSSGLYTAPTSAPSPDTVAVTASSISNPGLSGSTTVTISASNIGVTISPSAPSVSVNAKQQFTATVTGTTNTAVTWSLSGYACAGSTCGTISSTGLYTAPATAPVPPFVTVTATSVVDTTKSASTSVTIVPQVLITISPTSAQILEGQTQQFTASVTGTTSTGVSWSVSGTGCSGSGCGTISSSGLYTAPESVPSKVVVTATSDADSNVSASANVTIITPVVVTVSPTTSIIALGTQQAFQVSVTGSQNKAVTWSVSGSGCSGSGCGTISSAGVYTAPGSLPSPATVIVKATSQALASASATATVSLVGSNNSKLAGQYAFSFTGYDANGSYLAAGSFTADGNGNITSGEEDVNNVVAPATAIPLSGTYQVTSDNRGTLTLVSSLGNYTYKFALNSLGKKGRLMSFDQTGVRGSGVIELQDPTAFDPSVLANGYVLALSGEDASAGRVAALGLIFPDGAGFVSGSTLDENDAGSVAPTVAPFSGVYSLDSTGRGTMTLLVPGIGSGALNFAFYIVSANEFFLVSSDPIMVNSLILGGPAEIQNGAPFSPASFNGGSIFTLSGTTGSAPQDMVGRFNFDGSVNTVVNFDQNKAGTITVGGSMTGAYDLENNGRGTLNLDTSSGTLVWYMYATGPNQGFLMDASTAAAGLGQLFNEVIIPPFSNSDILGSYITGPDDPIVQTTPLVTGVDNFDGGSSAGGQGHVSGAEDVNKGSSLSTNQVVAGTYTVSGVSNNGRGTIQLTSPTGETLAVWVASSSEFVGLDIGSATTQPVVLHFEQ